MSDNYPKIYCDEMIRDDPYSKDIISNFSFPIHNFFADFSQEVIDPGSIYLIGVSELWKNSEKVFNICDSGEAKIVFIYLYEGSETLIDHLTLMRMVDKAKNKNFLIVSGGNCEPEYNNFHSDLLSRRVLLHPGNIDKLSSTQEIYTKANKPYKFLFLNGTARVHRKYLIERFKQENLLDQSLWTCLDNKPPSQIGYPFLYLNDGTGKNLIDTVSEYKFLPKEYEIPDISNNLEHLVSTSNTKDDIIKYELFGGNWKDGELAPQQYIDTYFSLVTETSFRYNHTMRTEKLWKPIMIGHPFIVAANPGFYRDLRNLGFKTFDKLIDESFDDEMDMHIRLEKIIQVVKDLCKQDLYQFIRAAGEICLYNQHLFIEYTQNTYKEFPKKLVEFINKS